MKLTKTLDDTFMLSKKDAEKLATDFSNIDDKIKDLEKKSDLDKKDKKVEIDKKSKELQDKVKEKTQKAKLNFKKKMASVKKKNKIEIEDITSDRIGKKEDKMSTAAASKEIIQLFNAMLQRKQFINRVRSIEIELKKDGRNSLMFVDGIEFMKLNVDGNGQLTLRLESSDNSRKVFRFIIIPLLRVLNEYFGGKITISNKKDADKILSFNSEKTIYVSSDQIKNKPVKLGQIIHFTNLKHGKFVVK